MRAGSLATLVAAIAVMLVGAGALRAQETNDQGRMRAPSDNSGDQGRGWSEVPGERIAHTGQDGTFIVLRDGTVWEVYLPDRVSTSGWREGDFVIVKKHPLGQNIGQEEYTYELINGRADSRAAVRFKGRT
jgi:hypothetical protein